MAKGATAAKAPTSHRRERRTQAERVAETRIRLLDATVDCLADIGYARMTTADVAARAGMSRGAQLYHFESKAELVATAVEHLLDRMHAQFLEAVATVPEGAERGPAVVDILWEIVSSPTFSAWLELAIAARTDTDLAPRVADVQNRFVARIAITFFQLFPARGGPASAEHAAAAPLVFSMLIGLAVQRQVEGGPDFSESLLPVVKAMAPQFLPPAGEAASP